MAPTSVAQGMDYVSAKNLARLREIRRTGWSGSENCL